VTAFETFTLRHVFFLACGGATGTVVRYAVSLYFKQREWADHFFWHTFFINVSGSFILGLVAVLCLNRPGFFLLLGTGFCGGYTTFSTFSVEALSLFEKHRPGAAIGYVLGSVVLGIVGAWVGTKLARG
jgi:CrcB protein